MRHPITIFGRGPQTPISPSTPGIAIAAPGRRGPARGGVAWLHGAITIPLVEANERGPQWLRSLNVTAVTQIDQVAQIAPLLQRVVLYDEPRWSTSRDALHASLGFAVDLGLAFRYPLHGETVYVHVSARSCCSETIELDLAPITDPPALDTPRDRLFAAYDFARLGQLEQAAALFEALLLDNPLRTDLDGAHLYNYACVLARLDRREHAIELLREDTERRAKPQIDAMIDLLASLEGSSSTPQSSPRELDLASREHFQHLAHDLDLDNLGDARSPRALLLAHLS
jgi:tetratricopeptide (TPR) repeat protein